MEENKNKSKINYTNTKFTHSKFDTEGMFNIYQSLVNLIN